MVADVNFPKVDIQSTDEERHRRQMAGVINSLRDGKFDSALTFSLELAPATSTTVSDERIASTSKIHLHPFNQAAVDDYGAGAVEVLTVNDGSFVVSHTAYGLARTFRCSFFS